MKQRFPRRARPLVAVAVLAFASFGVAAASHVTKRGPDLVARLYVIQVCRSEDPAVRDPALKGLRKLGARAMPALVGRAREEPLQDELFIVLAEFADESCVDLVAAGVTGGGLERRLAAARGLARIGTAEAALALGPALADPSPEVRAAAREGMRGHSAETLRGAVALAIAVPSMVPEFIRQVLLDEGMIAAAVAPVSEALRSEDPTRVSNAIYLAHHVFPGYPPGRESEPPLVSALLKAMSRLDPGSQGLAIETLGALAGPEAAEALGQIALNRRLGPQPRLAAVRALGQRRDAKTLAALEETMREPLYAVRLAAAEALGAIGSAEDADRWLGQLERGALDRESRDLMLRAVALAGGASLTARLLALARSTDSAVPIEAVRRVAAKDPVTALPALIDSIADAAPQAMPWLNGMIQDLTWHRSVFRHVPPTMEEFRRVREAVDKDWRLWWSLNKDRNPEDWKTAGAKELEADLAGGSALERLDAVARLVRMEPADLETRLLPLLGDSEESVWAKVQQVLISKSSPAGREVLRNAVVKGDALAAGRAARVLGLVEDRTSLEWILKGAARKDPGVRRDCAYALGRLADPKGSKALAAMLRDEDAGVRAAARDALDILGDRTVEAELIAGLGSSDADYRLSCILLLGRVGGPACVRPLVKLFGDDSEPIQRAAIRAIQDLTGRMPPLHPGDGEIRGWEQFLERRSR